MSERPDGALSTPRAPSLSPTMWGDRPAGGGYPPERGRLDLTRPDSARRHGHRPRIPALTAVRLRAAVSPPRRDDDPQGRDGQPDPLVQGPRHRLPAPRAGRAGSRLRVRIRRQL